MVKTISKKPQKLKLANFLLFCLLVVFPFGQILKLGFINLFDIVVGLISIFILLTIKKYPDWYRNFVYFLIFALFSWVFNAIIFNNVLVFKGLLYLVRLFIYSLIPVFITNYFKNKDQIYKYLQTVIVVIAIFAWLQYLFMPDLRVLKILNWDDHYYRLVGTFLDPGFTAIILVLGAILAIYKKKYAIFLFLIISLLFTYSRAGYLALLVGLGYFFYKLKTLNVFIFVIICLFVIGNWLLPNGLGGEGVNLARTSTISARILNYRQSFEIFKKSPVIGVGLNNICSAKIIYLNEVDISSHSCFGLDSSILFILATTGVVGLILFGYMVYRIWYMGSYFFIYNVLYTSFFAVLIHSLFSNSLFYPHVMVWMGILLGLGGKVKVKNS